MKSPAAAMTGQIDRKTGTARMERLLALQNEISAERNSRLMGKTVRVLSEGISKNDASVYTGRTDQNKIVFFKKPVPAGEWCFVKIDRTAAFALWGEIQNEQ